MWSFIEVDHRRKCLVVNARLPGPAGLRVVEIPTESQVARMAAAARHGHFGVRGFSGLEAARAGGGASRWKAFDERGEEARDAL